MWWDNQGEFMKSKVKDLIANG
jgi:alpha-mannosidase